MQHNIVYFYMNILCWFISSLLFYQ